MNVGLYTSLFVPKASWLGVIMDFILGLPFTQQAMRFYFYYHRQVLKDGSFHNMSKYYSWIVHIYFNEVVRLHDILKSVTLIITIYIYIYITF